MRDIGPVTDWVKRYSKNYSIVRGVHGGSHFHILASTVKDKSIKPIKGVHFCIRDYTSQGGLPLTAEDTDEIRRCQYVTKEIIQNTTVKLNCPIISLKIAGMISQYFLKKKNYEAKNKLKSTLEKRIQITLEYMIKNLSEPREGEIKLYRDYINVKDGKNIYN